MLVASLLLASLGVGVGVARAEAGAAGSGPVCSAARPHEQREVALEAFLDGVRRQAVSRRAGGSADRDGWVVLNNRGYNYTSTYRPPAEDAAPSAATSR